MGEGTRTGGGREMGGVAGACTANRGRRAARSGARRPVVSVVVGTACGALLLAACGSSSTATSTARAAAKKVAGGTVTWAEAPNATPNYIFPLAAFQYFSVANLSQFQELMYRPLYWFGKAGKPVLNEGLSLADPPVFSDHDRVVTIHLKPYKWSDGEPVSARDVLFWMHLLKAEKSIWAGYVAGAFPDNVIGMKALNSTTVQFTLNGSYNPTWFTYNELSQITPLPLAWDRTSLSQPIPSATATSLPASTPAGAKAVYNFLNTEAKKLSTYATSPLWSVVDGPWKLKSFSTDGRAVFVPNPKYSGSPKPSISEFIEEPFTSSTAEFDLLRSAKNALTVGYLPLHDFSQATVLKSMGYRLVTTYPFGFNYFVPNLNNPTVGPIFRQLYVRQALQHLVDQTGWIKAFDHGVAAPSYGPVPVEPANDFVSPFERSNPYPFSVAAAKKLLASHGWKVVAGVQTCENPGTGAGQCGAGIAKGATMDFTLEYATGSTTIKDAMINYQSEAAQAGIKINLTTGTFDQVIGVAVACTPSQSTCKWEMGNWGGGWVYSPDYEPTGGEIFATGAGSNASNYSSKTADHLIDLTHTAPASQSLPDLYRYEDYIAKDLPVIFQPEEGTEVVLASNLGGWSFNPYENLDPESWYFTK
jgi:peptide/nickel transport system substrate-binding protein